MALPGPARIYPAYSVYVGRCGRATCSDGWTMCPRLTAPAVRWVTTILFLLWLRLKTVVQLKLSLAKLMVCSSSSTPRLVQLSHIAQVVRKSGEWHLMEGCTANPSYRGYIVFTLMENAVDERHVRSYVLSYSSFPSQVGSLEMNSYEPKPPI